MSTDVWIDMETVVYCIHNEILFSHKKNETSPFMTTWMDLKGIMLRKRRQRKTDIIRSISYVLMDTENRWMVARGGR